MKLIQVVLLKNVIGCIERIQIVEKRIYTIISPNDICKKLDPVPFHKVYLLHAQTQFESYGRTKSFLIIGMMM